MPPHEWIAQYGALVVFLNVLGASLGLPLPVMPTLIAVGASHALGPAASWSIAFPLSLILGTAILAGVLADLVWFRGGKRYGARTLHTVCNLSLSREACVSRTERFFERWGVRLLIVARFMPGLSLVAVPLCGAMGVRLRSFIWHDCVGVALWASAGLTLGAAFAAQIQDLLAALSALGGRVLVAAGVATALYLAYRHGRRAVAAKALEKARIAAQ
ncbi:DedA family protein [Achromobacter deleyi]|uniref:DedA family protein n=1 Tax=Achromobacter deleyi TaxID=1353891 RepID=UPI001491A86F|nr:DedA family protein [Achromobacter deleyi]QVQ27190.1 DedA family protein [Achromobacter deleyi]UIP22779.1 DedA family protein [Achromobacter deleyi]